MNSGIKVIAPASISNLACGFDILGLALETPGDEIIGRIVDTPGVRIVEITGQKKNIPFDVDKNTACKAAAALLTHLGEAGRGIEFKIHKHIPAGSGMGSSASSAVAAVLLVNELLNHPLEKRDLIPFALEGEKLASGDPVGDNIVASMLGGLVLIRDIRALDFHRIYTPPGLFVSVLLPEIVVSTIESRSALKPDVPLSAFIHQSANLGAFVIGMQTGDLDLISRSMKDLVIESQRKHYIPHFDLLQATAMEMGALGCSISGAGPAVFALCREKGLANDVASNMKFIYDKHKLNAQSFVSAINNEGAILK